jgi:hypothetical protein
MPIARRDRYEWECVLSVIEMAREDDEFDLGLRRLYPELLATIYSKIRTVVDGEPHNGEWNRIPIELTDTERNIVNRRLVPAAMARVSYQLERLDLLGLHAVDDDYEDLRDRILCITTNSPKSRDDVLSIWISHIDVVWLDDWLTGCTTSNGDLR